MRLHQKAAPGEKLFQMPIPCKAVERNEINLKLCYMNPLIRTVSVLCQKPFYVPLQYYTAWAFEIIL
jgi:hypothetical protein